MLDALGKQVFHSPRVSQLLLQRQAPMRFQEPSGSGSKRNAEEVVQHPKPAKKQKANKNNQSSGGKGGGGKGNGGKGAGKTPAARVPLPKELLGLTPDHHGQRVCFAYNMGGCTTRNCNKGVHVCMRCGSNSHGASSSSCPKKK